jgi:hypothetical protein
VKGNESNFPRNGFIVPVSTILSKYPNWLEQTEPGPVATLPDSRVPSCGPGLGLRAGLDTVGHVPLGRFDIIAHRGPFFGVRLISQSTGPRSLESRQP